MPGVLLALLALLVLITIGPQLAHAQGAWRTALLLSRFSVRLFGSGWRDAVVHIEASALRESGQLEAAVRLVSMLAAPETASPFARNTAVDVLISAGRYRAALAAEGPSPPLRIMQINLAEAEYNLGCWDAAEARLRKLGPSGEDPPFVRAMFLLQRAWIAAHRGRGHEALELWTRVEAGWMPKIYRAEYHFTHAVALLAAGDAASAEAALDRAAPRRISSKRNALFLRARIAAARGDWTAAERLCRSAAAHPFRAQGGEGLSLWAEALHRLGRPAEAREALRLLAERDPESESARLAPGEEVGPRDGAR